MDPARRRLRLLSVTKSTGGLAVYNTRLCRWLDPERFDLQVICLSENNQVYADELNTLGIKATPMEMERYAINVFSDLRLAVQLWRHLRRERYDVVIGHGTKAGFLARLVGFLTGTPAIYRLASMAFVTRVHGRSAHLYCQLERVGALWGGHIVTLADATRDELIRRRIAPARRVSVIRTGIDLAAFGEPLAREVACRSLSLDPSRPVVGWAARMVAQKAPLDYVRAAARIVEAVPEAQIFMAGTGPLEDEVRRLVRTLGLETHFTLAPWQSDAVTMLSAFDVYVLSSHWEGLSQGLLEAMALRRAAVATAVDGTAEVIRHGVDGYLVTAGDDGKMAEYVVSLLKNEALRHNISLAARARIEASYSVAQMAAAWEALIMRVIKGEKRENA